MPPGENTPPLATVSAPVDPEPAKVPPLTTTLPLIDPLLMVRPAVSVKAPFTLPLVSTLPLLLTSPVSMPVLPRTKVAPGEIARLPPRVPVTASVPPCTLVPPV